MALHRSTGSPSRGRRVPRARRLEPNAEGARGDGGLGRSLVLFLGLLALLAPLATGAAAGEAGGPGGPAPAVHEVKAGDTLWRLSEQRYGNRHYAKIVQAYNHIDDPAAVGIGDRIRLPDLRVVLADEGLTAVMADEVDGILSARARYMEVEERLWDLRHGSARGAMVDIPDDIRDALTTAAAELDKAAAGFGAGKPGVVKAPKSLIGQLKTTSGNLRTIASGLSDGYGYDLDMVHQRLVLAMYNGIIWARNGFE